MGENFVNWIQFENSTVAAAAGSFGFDLVFERPSPFRQPSSLIKLPGKCNQRLRPGRWGAVRYRVVVDRLMRSHTHTHVCNHLELVTE